MSRPLKRSFAIKGHRTSITLEAPFWEALREAARREGVPLAVLVARIDAGRGASGLSSAIRVWLLGYEGRLTSASPLSRRKGPAEET